MLSSPRNAAAISAEREGKNARQVLESLAGEISETDVAISVVTLIELAHGAIRADTSERKLKREKFLEELLIAMPVYPVTVTIALRTGRLDAENQIQGFRVPLPDLLIGVTALEFGYSVATSNLRHFKQIPELKVLQL